MTDPQTEVSPRIEAPVRLLIVEDDANDVERCLTALKEAGLAAAADVVQTREEFTQQVRAKTYDLILADYRLPNWKGTEVSPLLRLLGFDIPVILVTGVLDDENVVECLHLGVTDVVFKDRLERLPEAVRRALKEFAFRQETLWAREELAQANQMLSAQVNELQRQSNENSVIREMGDLLQTCVTAEEAYQAIRQAARVLFAEESGALCMLNASHNLLGAVAIWGDFQPSEGVFAPEDCWGLRRGRTQVLEDPQSGLTCKHLGPSPAPGSVCVPLMAQGESLGLLHLNGGASAAGEAKQRGAQPRQLLAEMVAERIALALANLKLRESLRWQSSRDPLTGLFNRRYMEESFEREMCRAIRNHRPLSAIMLDIDHFKSFNDTFGHEAGDTMLTAVGGSLQGRTRKEDIACRYGGEEFALILPEAALGVAQQRADKLREDAKRLYVHCRGQALGKIAFSLGVSSYPEHGDSPSELLRIADAALYGAKAEGRDRVVVGQSADSNVEAQLTAQLRPAGPAND